MGTSKPIDKDFEKIVEMIKKIVDERVSNGVKEDDYIQMVIDNADKIGDDQLDYREITLCIYGFLFAAQTNTFAVMGWTLLHILRNQNVLDEVFREQKSIFSNDDMDITLVKLDQMTF